MCHPDQIKYIDTSFSSLVSQVCCSRIRAVALLILLPQDIRSLVTQEKQMPALSCIKDAWQQSLVFLLRSLKNAPDIISGANQIRGTTQIPYVKNENYFYIHDKTLNSRNEWGNVIPYQIHNLCSRILPVCGSRGNFDSAWTSGSFSAGGLPSLSGK